MGVKTLTIGNPTTENLEHPGDIIIASHYSGTLHCEGRLTVQKDGMIEGEVHAQTAHISGSFKGFLEVQQYVIFTDGSKFQGTLDAPSMVCSLGTTLVGDVRVKPQRPLGAI